MTSVIHSVCGYCGVGCGLTVRRDGEGQLSLAGRPDHPTNAGRLCTKGTTTLELLSGGGRMTTASARSGRTEQRVAVDLDHALDAAAAGLRAAIEEYGPDAVALYVSGQMSLESQYLATKLAKGFLRTTNLESNSRLCMASASTGYKQSLGADGPPGSYDDFDHADLFLVIGSNMADAHPILFLRMMQRVAAGARLIVVDPRRTRTAEAATLHLQIQPGTDLALLNGLLRLLVDDDAVDHGFIAEHTTGWAEVQESLADYSVDRVARLTGLSSAELRTAATWIAQAGDWMTCWTMGLNQSTHGTWSTNLICNLHLATGAILRGGSGPFSLTGQPNAMGGREMGYMGAGLPGQRTVLDAADRAHCEQRWGLAPGTIRSDVGAGTIEMFRDMAAGAVKAVWVICTNPAHSVANRATVIEALQRCELVVVQDAYERNETMEYADVTLPATLWAEGEGVLVNSERTLNLGQPFAAAPGDAHPDWWLICQVAQRMGYPGFDYSCAEEIFDELREFHNPATGYDLRGISYDRLREQAIQWPSPPGDIDQRHPIRYLNDGRSQTLLRRADGSVPSVAFPRPDGRAAFLARPHMPPAELPDDEFPMVLNTGRLAHQWHTMTKTGRVPSLNRLNPAPFVEIHPSDAARLQLADGSPVLLTTRRGEAVLPALTTERVRPGACFVPMHWGDEYGALLAVNALTNDATDPSSLQPEYKVCSVRLEPSLVPCSLTAPARELPAAPVDKDAVQIAWASQTGTVEDYVPELVQQLADAGVRALPVNMAALTTAHLAGTVLFVTSTTGDAEPPDDAREFSQFLQSAEPPALETLQYAVLAFGDPAYRSFCGFGRDLDERLSQTGGRRLVPCGQCPPDYDAAAQDWVAAVVAALRASGSVPHRAAATTHERTDHGAGTRERPRSAYGRKNPLQTRLLANHLLGRSGSAKEVRRVAFDLPTATLTYEAGDALAVVPHNDPAYIEEFLAVCHLDGEEHVTVDGSGLLLRDALAARREICSITPQVVAFVAERRSDADLQNVSRLDTAAFNRWRWGRHVVDLLREHPVRATGAQWLDVLAGLTARQYSISSSAREDPRRVEITCSVVRFQGPRSRRGGVCSTYLADRASESVSIFVQRQRHFRPPADRSAPAIMIGPGTGVAPFRGFLRERRAAGHDGRNWLLFGEQHEATDFYYQDEWRELLADGTLNRLDTAFSRDTGRKIYVQDRIRQHGETLWQWLEQGAHVYICGDKSRMAPDVEAALCSVAVDHGRMSAQQAHEWLQAMSAQRRYARDVY